MVSAFIAYIYNILYLATIFTAVGIILMVSLLVNIVVVSLYCYKCFNPAVMLTDITITGRISIEPSRTSTMISTSSSVSIRVSSSLESRYRHVM